MGFVDSYLKNEHKDAAEDFKEGKEEKGKEVDDTIGYIHDLLKEHHGMLTELLKRTEHLSDGEQKEAVETAEHVEEKEDK